MSLRTAARLARSSRPLMAARPAPQLTARRAASSGGHKAPASDMTWIMGSAVIFVPLTAWVLTPSKGGAHHSDSAHGLSTRTAGDDTTGLKSHSLVSDESDAAHGKGNAHDLNSNAAPGEEKEESGEGEEQEEGSDSKEALASAVQGLKTDAPPVAAAAGDKKENAETSPESSSSESGSVTPDNVDESDAPSNADLKSSLSRSEKTAVPRIAMSEEAQGHDTQASLDK